MALFTGIPEAPLDPILGVTTAFNEDSRTNKVNLGVGIYKTAELKPSLLNVVKQAEIEMAQQGAPRPYLGSDGSMRYIELIAELLLGEAKAAALGWCGAQSVGGTGGLRVVGEFLARLTPVTTLYVPNPTWGNHKAIFGAAGLEVKSYPYFDKSTGTMAFDQLLDTFKSCPEQSVVLLHAACHNPTGNDPTVEQWREILDVVQQRKLIPLFDCAYQGFGDGIEEDVQGLRLFAKAGLDMFVCYSCSKNFGLYSERVGAVLVITQNPKEGEIVQSQLRALIRSIYSNPPFHGQKVVETILSSAELRKDWTVEVTAMRDRIQAMRKGLVAALHAKTGERDFSFLAAQKGMFSFMGLEREQVQQLRAEYGIYTPPNGRLNVAGLNSENIDYVAEAIAAVL